MDRTVIIYTWLLLSALFIPAVAMSIQDLILSRIAGTYSVANVIMVVAPVFVLLLCLYYAGINIAQGIIELKATSKKH